MAIDNKPSSSSNLEGPSTPPPDIDPLITQNKTVLPEVYEHVYLAQMVEPTAISTKTGLNRQVVHKNLRRLVDAGLVRQQGVNTYQLAEPTLEPTVVQSLSELGSPLRWAICAFAVDQGKLVVTDLQRAFDVAPSNARNILNALAENGYLAKRESARANGVLVYHVTDEGTRALQTLENPTAYLGREGETVQHYANGIEGTPFRTAYGIEDVYIISQHGGATVNELLTEIDKAEKATRRRLNRLTERNVLEKTRRRERNTYSPTPRTRAMIEAVRGLEDDRRLQAWKTRIPEACVKQVPEPFFPKHIFEVFSKLLHRTSPELADEYITIWKAAGLVKGNRSRGFRFVQAGKQLD